MKRPKSVKIGPMRFRVEYVEYMGGDHIGAASYQQAGIRIEEGDEQVMRDTLLHECMHMVLYMTGHIDESGDEKLVSSVSTQLLSLMRDNKALVDYLVDK